MRRVEAIPAVKEQIARQEHAAPFWLAAKKVAYLPVSDDEALKQLRSILGPDRAALADATEFSSHIRSDFISDREFRLLKALSDDAPVRIVDPALADLFREEEELGRMTLASAFGRLCDLEPGLKDAAAAAGRDPPPDKQKSTRSRSGISEMVGIGARTGLPILMSDISASIVKQYLAILSGDMRGDLNTSYFGAPQITGHSGSIGLGGVQAPSRRQAQN